MKRNCANQQPVLAVTLCGSQARSGASVEKRVALNATKTDREAGVEADAACTASAQLLPDRKPDMPSGVTSGDLLRGRQELLIHHGEEVYRLRLTGRGKLILMK
jgi:hemin uptake protein HemP